MTFIRFIALIMMVLIPASAAAQGKLLFENPEWDFGTILETDGRVSHTFIARNVGNDPIVILDVVTSCGCTVPEFSKQPLLPGREMAITVTYDPANRPGVFNKELWVYSSERKRIATLRIRGDVTPRVKSAEELYPVDAGNGLRLTSTLCAFAYLYPGQMEQSAIGCANLSQHPIRIELRPEAESGLLRLKYPRQLEPGQRAQIDISYLIPSSKPRYGTLRDVMEVVVNGRSNGTTLVLHAIGVDTPPAGSNAPKAKAQFSENFLKFGSIRRSGGVQRRTLSLSNTGNAELIVRAVECDGPVRVSLAPGRTIPPGSSADFEVSVDPATLDYGVLSKHLTVITNDPSRPMRRLRITAIVEE